MCAEKQNPGYGEHTLVTEEAQDMPGTCRRLTSLDYNILGTWGAGLLGVVISLARRITAGFESLVLHQNNIRGGSSVERALGWQSRGRWFNPTSLHQI